MTTKPQKAAEAAPEAAPAAAPETLDPILTFEQRDATNDVPEAFAAANKRKVVIYKEPSQVDESVTSLGFAMRSYS